MNDPTMGYAYRSGWNESILDRVEGMLSRVDGSAETIRLAERVLTEIRESRQDLKDKMKHRSNKP